MDHSQIPIHPPPAGIMKRRSQIAPVIYLDSPRWMSNPMHIPTNPTIPLDSVVPLIAAPPIGRGYGPVPTPDELRGISRELRSLRRSKVWKRRCGRDEQVAAMEEWFPDIPGRDTMTPDAEDRDVEMPDPSINSPDAPTKTFDDAPGCPTSNIGIFSKLPGEIRNRIYRLAVTEPESKPVSVEMKPGTCTHGACLHSKVSINMPGIASTCRQLRWEVAPIFLAENTGFAFDDEVVRQCCVNNYLRTLGSYVDLIKQFSFKLKRSIWQRDAFVKYLTYTFTLTPPSAEDEDFALEQHEEGDQDICQCQLNQLVSSMNKRKHSEGVSVGKLVQEFVDSEEFADFVWRAHKTKQWTSHLPKCKKCGEVYFNS